MGAGSFVVSRPPGPHAAFALAAALLLAAGCGATDSGGGDGGDGNLDSCPRTLTRDLPLLTHDQWKRVTSAEDPMGSHKPANYRCAPGSHIVEGWTAETKAVEVDTRDCNYIALTHPIAHPICKGDTLSVSAWHLNLTAAKKATAHFALFLGKDLLWETRVPIPQQAKSYSPRIAARKGYPKGTRLLWHLHNHGTNVWTFHQLEVKAR